MEISEITLAGALASYKNNRDIAPLVEMLERGDAYLLKSEEARKILAQAALGLAKIGKGRTSNKDNIQRNRQITRMVAMLHAMGLPIKNSPIKNRTNEAQRPSACRVVAEYHSLSEDTMYDVWAAPAMHLDAAIYKEVGLMLASEGKAPTIETLRWFFDDRSQGGG